MYASPLSIPLYYYFTQLQAANGTNYHAGESKRPIAERTPNSWETERPIDDILIEMAQEAGRYPCLELNN